MIDYEYGALFSDDSIKKEIIIKYGNTTIANEDLFNQELELDESLCSEEQLKFGSCEASVIKFRVANIVSPVKGNWISITMTIDGHTENPLPFGRYKVESDKPTSDRKWREIVAYDALYDMINDDVSDWYNSVLPNKNVSMPLSKFRKLFLQKYSVEEEIDAPLANDSMVVTRTIDPDELSGAKVITAICELNGVFGHIDRNGKFKSVQLIQGIKGLYPRNDLYPANDLYPRDPKSTPIGKGIYISCEYEDFTVNSITGIDIYKEENALGGSSGSPENKYVVEDNFLVYGKSEQELQTVANNLLSAIRGLDYRPFGAECKGNPCFEVGDPVRLSTKYEIIESYILTRTLKGIQALKDSYSASGTEKYEIKVNSTSREIAQVSGRTEQLEREYDEQQEDIENINSDIDGINQGIGEINSNVGNLKIELKKTDDGLHAEVSRATSAEAYIGSRVDMTVESIDAEVRRAQDSENYLSGRINLTAESITAEVIRAQGAENTLSSRINMTAESITAEVTRAQGAENYLSSQLSITAGQISTKVTAGEVSSLIDQKADSIRLKAGAIVIDSTYFSVESNGYATMSGGKIGSFTLTNYGSLQGSGIEISGSQLYCNSISSYTGSYVSIDSSLEVNGSVKFPNVYGNTISGDANLGITTTGYVGRTGGSLRKWKRDIRPIQDAEIDAHRLYNTRVCQFIYRDDYLPKTDCRSGKPIPGFTLDTLKKDYPIAVDYDEFGNPVTWSPRMIIPGMLVLLQEQKKEIDKLKAGMQMLLFLYGQSARSNLLC